MVFMTRGGLCLIPGLLNFTRHLSLFALFRQSFDGLLVLSYGEERDTWTFRHQRCVMLNLFLIPVEFK